jgi:hypothetical protein
MVVYALHKVFSPSQGVYPFHLYAGNFRNKVIPGTLGSSLPFMQRILM